MNIVMISGSPHRHGTTARLADSFIAGAREAGHSVKRFDVAFMDIHPCMGCNVCKTEKARCVFPDDMTEVGEALMDSDCVVFVTPIYYNGFTAQMKTVIDRFFAVEPSIRKNQKTEVFGCPISSNGYAPQIHEYERPSCDECGFCKEITDNPSTIKCSGRFGAYLDQVETVLETESIDGTIFAFMYIAKDGSICRTTVDIPESPAASIIELARDYNPGIMIIQNIRSGYRFKITKNVDEMLVKYSRVYGYYWNERFNDWSKKSNEIYGPWKAEWIVVWFTTKEQTQQYFNRFNS